MPSFFCMDLPEMPLHLFHTFQMYSVSTGKDSNSLHCIKKKLKEFYKLVHYQTEPFVFLLIRLILLNLPQSRQGNCDALLFPHKCGNPSTMLNNNILERVSKC